MQFKAISAIALSALALAACGGSASGTDEKDLQSMMRDPKYWRDKDPAYIAKVTAGFEKIYSQK